MPMEKLKWLERELASARRSRDAACAHVVDLQAALLKAAEAMQRAADTGSTSRLLFAAAEARKAAGQQ